ncbi:MAG: autotransporter-associated beta strand repeat-containing protein [Verrucomicrobiota bacterium]
MKLRTQSIHPLGLIVVGLSVAGLTYSAQAATHQKANNPNNLNITASWSDAVLPGPADIAAWSSTVTAANSVLLGADLSWGGISITNPGGGVTIGAGNTLTLGSSGIDMSTATQNFTVSSGLTLLGGSGQSWSVASGRSLTLNTGTFTRNAGATLNVQGTVTANPPLVNSMVGPWATLGTGTATTYAKVTSGNLAPYTGHLETAGQATSTWDGIAGGDSHTLNFVMTGAGGTYPASASARNVNTIQYNGTAAASQAGSSITLNGFLNTGGGAFTIGSTVTIGASLELVLNTAAADILIGAAISNNGTASALTSTGPNTVTLTGTNTYTGPTSVTGGTLLVSGTGAINTSSGININGSGAKFLLTSSVASTPPVTLTQGTLDGIGTVGAVTVANNPSSIIASGNGGAGALTMASLTFGGAATVNLNVAGGAAGLPITGALTTTPANGQVVLNVTSSTWVPGANNLISYGSLSGAVGNFTLGTVAGLSARQAVSGPLVTNGNNIALNISGDTAVWSGAHGGIWTTGTANSVGATPDWALKTTHTQTDFWPADSVEFNDTVNISGSLSVPLSTITIHSGDIVDVSPASTIFNNSAVDYTLTTDDGSGITGTGGLVKNGTGTLVIDSSVINSYSGPTHINGGVLSVTNLKSGGSNSDIGASSNIASNLVFTGSTLRFVAATTAFTDRSFTITSGSSATFEIADSAANLTITGAVAATNGSLVKTGDGKLTLSGYNLHTGGTTVNGGTLALGTGGGTGAIRGILTINSGAAVNLAAGDALGYSSGLRVDTVNINGGTLTGLGGNQGFSTNFILTGGTMAATAGAYNFDSVNGYGVTTLASSSASLISGGIAIRSGTLPFNVAAGSVPGGIDLLVSGVIGGGANSVIKNGAGTMLLSGANTYTGTTTISAGTLQLGNGSTTGSLASTAEVANAGTLVFNRSDALALPNVISGAGSVIQRGTGTTTLSGGNIYTGNTTVNSGTLETTNALLADTADVSIGASAILKLSFSGSDTVHALTINGAAKAPGTYGATGSGAANIDNVHFAGTGTLTVTTGPSASAYATWALAKGLTVGVNDGPTQDPDHDGIPNALEFALGGNPLASGTSILPTLTETPTTFVFTFKRADESEAEITVKFQYGSSLTGWTDVAIGATTATSGPEVSIAENGSAPDTVTVTIPRSRAVGGKLFGRLKAVK